jgi:PadR family transcriptional regulator PadR
VFRVFVANALNRHNGHRTMAVAAQGDLIYKLEQMSREFLGHFELMVLLSLIRLGDDAYGVPIASAIRESSGREVALGSVYASLDRLVEKGFVSSRVGEPTAERGGRAKRYFQITASGLREVRAARRALTRLWAGLPEVRGDTA